MPITTTTEITAGTRVSYEDMANPYREGEVVKVIASEWITEYLVSWYGGGETFTDLRQHGWNLLADDDTLCAVHEAGACPPGCEHAHGYPDGPADPLAVADRPNLTLVSELFYERYMGDLDPDGENAGWLSALWAQATVAVEVDPTCDPGHARD